MDLVVEREPALAQKLGSIEPEQTIVLTNPLTCTVQAVLGELQATESESFIPLNVLKLTPTRAERT